MLALAVLAPAAASAAEDPRVTIAILPYGTAVEEIATVPGISPGILSAGLGSVPVAQTYLDISQGNRVSQRLYERELPRLYIRDGRVPERLWERTLERAEGAPADVVPGLLASTLAEAGVPVVAEADSGLATVIAVGRDGTFEAVEGGACQASCEPGLSVLRARLPELPALAASLEGDDLLIAIAAGQRADQQLLPTGIAGAGFGDGSLTSASTRTDGVVTATDIAPTVLDRFGVEIPDEVNGSEIEAGVDQSSDEVAELQSRLENRPSRDLVLLYPVAAWLLLAGIAALVWRGTGARPALRLVGLAAAWAPFMLLVASAVAAGELASAALSGLAAPALAFATDRLLPGYRGLAVACAASVGAHAVDVVAGSHLTSLSLLGPNPGGGVRFFGIGNELEAILTTLTLVGTGAWLASRPEVGRRATAAWFVGVAALAIAAFAPGRFGADVGAAIVLSVGATAAAVLALGLSRGRAIAIVVGGGALALGALLLIDLVLGGAHLSRSVLGAGEAGDVLDVVDRRITLMAGTFTDPVYPELLAAAAVLLIVAAIRRHTILAWFGDSRPARYGFLGASAGIAVGTVANDSGSVLLVIGLITLALCAGFFWGSGEARESP